MQRSLRVRAVTRGLAPIEPTDNVLIAYAARDGTTANDGEGRIVPSPPRYFTTLETPGLEISFLFRNVRDEVMSTTKREQQPFVYGSLSKEAIYFKPLVPAPTLIAPSTTIAKLPTEQDTRKDGTAVPSGLKRNAYLPQDARRITAVAVEQELKMPPFAIGETKSSVSDTHAQFVGIWSNKAGFHGGRHVMLVITEITSDGVAVGYYLWGPPGKLSWAKNDPAGYVNFAGKITDGKLEFKSGEVPMDAMLSGASMTLHSVNPHRQKGQSKDAAIKLSPLWRLSILGSTVPEQPSDRQHAAPAATTKPRPSKQKAELDGDARPGRIVGLSMEDRYRACRKLVKGFAQREACARNGGIVSFG